MTKKEIELTEKIKEFENSRNKIKDDCNKTVAKLKTEIEVLKRKQDKKDRELELIECPIGKIFKIYEDNFIREWYLNDVHVNRFEGGELKENQMGFFLIQKYNSYCIIGEIIIIEHEKNSYLKILERTKKER